MMKKFLSGLLVSALVLGTVSAVNTTTAEAAVKVPKASYTFNMNAANKNVVAVARKGDTANMVPTEDAKKSAKGGIMPTAAAAKGIKLKYVKGKRGKCLYLDRSKSYGAQLKGVNLGTGSWTAAFWIKIPNGMGNFAASFFVATDLKDASAKWISITKRTDIADIGGSPIIWSHYVSGKTDNFPWYCKNGTDDKGEAKWEQGTAFESKSWVHVTLVVNAKQTGEYGAKGEDGYVKGLHAYTYINGKLYGNGCVAKGTYNSKSSVLLGINGWDIPMKAYYDEVMIWKKALTAKQVKKLYDSQK